METESKYAVIIGATGGIGASLCKMAIDSGYKVIGTGSTEASLKALEASFSAGSFIPHILDVCSAESLNSFTTFVIEHVRSITWLIQSAGFIDIKETHEGSSPEAIHKTFLINVESVALMTATLLPSIEKDGGVIFISSTAGLWGNQNFPIYSASKGALNSYSRSVAKAEATSGRSIVCICPGPTNTPMREALAHDANNHQSPDKIATVVKDILLKVSSYKNGDTLIIKNGKDSLHSSIES